jgi:hypothetical protein
MEHGENRTVAVFDWSFFSRLPKPRSSAQRPQANREQVPAQRRSPLQEVKRR